MFMYYLEDSIIIQAIIIIVSSSSVLLGKLAEREILNQNKREEKICIEILWFHRNFIMRPIAHTQNVIESREIALFRL